MWFGAEARARLAVLPVCALVLPWRCNLALPFADRGEPAPPPVAPVAPMIERREGAAASAATAKREQAPERVSSVPPRAPPVRAATLPEEVVMKAIGVGHAQFLRCWGKAQQDDPGLDASKVILHLEVDAAGKVTAARSDTPSPLFERCLRRVAFQLPFPAPGRPAVVELPLMFR